ncbi:class I SAM-dependent methyltransferase [Apilactobacillus ozensis]|uniref:class I SAM-dependent methyltransferase n=1 Tax=Apilactobacillus ozensis TaxID=866801 RepID=UPI00200A7204|nr:class I SAM-dependent methyltransferase [Apilactobacillus ozensis]MCK8606841.1 class I SAM-dependent methyltransferase [Apilactobacillus ozensis]
MYKKFKHRSNNQFVEVTFFIAFAVLFMTYLATGLKTIYLLWSLAFLIFTVMSFLRNAYLRNRLFKEFVDSIDVQDRQSILDLGSNDGFLIIQIANKLSVSSRTLIIAVEDKNQFSNKDFHTNAVNNRVKYRINLVNGDIRNLPYSDKSFDTITAANSLNSFLSSYKKSDCKKVCSEINRLLGHNGTAYIFNTSYLSKKMANEFIKQGNQVFFYDYKFQFLYGMRIFSVVKK